MLVAVREDSHDFHLFLIPMNRHTTLYTGIVFFKGKKLSAALAVRLGRFLKEDTFSHFD